MEFQKIKIKRKGILMYFCPTCNKKFPTEEKVVKHFLVCWKEKNPYHQSKEIIVKL